MITLGLNYGAIVSASYVATQNFVTSAFALSLYNIVNPDMSCVAFKKLCTDNVHRKWTVKSASLRFCETVAMCLWRSNAGSYTLQCSNFYPCFTILTIKALYLYMFDTCCIDFPETRRHMWALIQGLIGDSIVRDTRISACVRLPCKRHV